MTQQFTPFGVWSSPGCAAVGCGSMRFHWPVVAVSPGWPPTQPDATSNGLLAVTFTVTGVAVGSVSGTDSQVPF